MADVLPFKRGDGGPMLPHNDEVEQAFLAALLVDNNVYDHIGGLKPEHFFDGLHARIFEVAARLIEKGKPANAVSLSPYFSDVPELVDVGGGRGYLASLQASVVTTFGASGYASTITDLYRRREIMKAVAEANEDAAHFDMDVTAEAIADTLAERLYQVQEIDRQDRPLQDLGAHAMSVQQRTEAAARHEIDMEGVMTGISDLDSVLGGMTRSDLIILASRPSMGKTALATQIAYDVARRHAEDPKAGAPVLMVELEMSGEQLATRVLARLIGSSTLTISRGLLSAEKRVDMAREVELLAPVPLHIDDRSALTVQQVRNQARALKRKGGLGLIVVDYLQLMRAPSVRRETNRVQEVSEITAGLKALAKDLDVPVLALSQLSRALEQREDKRPQLSDLRESGSIEQDADIVMFLYREAYYLARERPRDGVTNHDDKLARWETSMEKARGKAEVIVAKHRHAATGVASLYFDEASTSFTNLQNDYQGNMYL